jgi:hypothetical protein
MCIMVAQNASALEVVGYSSGGRPAGGRDAEAQEQPHLRLQIPRLASQYTTVTCCRIRQQRVNYNLRAHPRLSAESPACGLAVGQGTK